MSDEGGLGRRRLLAVLGAAGLGGCSGAPSALDGTATETPSAADTDTDTDTTTRTTTTDATAPGLDVADLSWRMHGRDPTNTGTVATTGPSSAPEKVWDVPVEGIYTLPQPSLVDGTAFVGTGRKLYTMTAEDGDRGWTRRLDYLAHHYSPAVVDGTVFAPARTNQGVRSGGGEGRLYAVDAESGSLFWQRDGAISAPPTVVADTVYYTTSSDVGEVVAVGTDGTERWTYTFEAGDRRTSAYGAPAVADGTAYATVSAHRETGAVGSLVAVEDGAASWQVELGGEARAAPAVRDGTAYTGTVDGAVQATADDGELLWSTPTEGGVFSTPAVDEDHVYALVKGAVEAFDRETGERQWRTDIGSSLINGLAVAEDGIYLGGGTVTALAKDGQTRWKYPIPGATGGYGAPIVLGGAVFVGACIKWEPSDPYDDHVFGLA